MMSIGTSFDAEQRIWYGPKKPLLYNPNVNAAQVLLGELDRRPHHCGQIDATTDERLTNGELRSLAVRWAVQLRRRERIERGDRIGFVASNHPWLASLVLGSISLAAPLAPLSTLMSREEIAHLFGISKPRVIVCDAAVVQRVREALAVIHGDTEAGQIHIYTIDRRVPDELYVGDLLEADDAITIEEAQFTPTDVVDGLKHPLVLICTSGTTGKPKCICLSHALVLQQTTDSSIENVSLSFTSIYWIGGFLIVLIGMRNTYTRVITREQFNATELLRIVPKYRVTVVYTVPSSVSQLLKLADEKTPQALSTILGFVITGGGISQTVRRRLDSLLQVPSISVYGMSEIGGSITFSFPGKTPYASCGQLRSNIAVRLCAKDGRYCGPSETGEILVKCDAIPINGYWENAEATAELFDEDGWMRTGDLGYFDVSGNLYITDRIKDFIKSWATRIAPSEIEAILLQMDGVQECCICGVPEIAADGREEDYEVLAAVIRRSSDETGQQLTVESVREWAANRLSDAKQLHGGVYFVDEYPITASGKVKPSEVREMAIRWLKNDHQRL